MTRSRPAKPPPPARPTRPVTARHLAQHRHPVRARRPARPVPGRSARRQGAEPAGRRQVPGRSARPPGGGPPLPALRGQERRGDQVRQAPAGPSTAGTPRSSGLRTARFRRSAGPSRASRASRAPVGPPGRRGPRTRTSMSTGTSATRRRGHRPGSLRPPMTPPTGMTCWPRIPARGMRRPAARSSRCCPPARPRVSSRPPIRRGGRRTRPAMSARRPRTGCARAS